MEKNYERTFGSALAAHKAGQLEEAEKVYLEVLANHPESGRVLNALGMLYQDRSQWDQAAAMFEKAAGLNPPHLPASYNLARIKQQAGEYQRAIDIYREILKRQSNIGEVWNNLGVALRETGAPDEAISCFRRAVAFAPEMAEAWNNLGVAQDEFNLTENASNSYRKAIEIQPDYPSAHVNLGISLQKRHRYVEAEEHYRKALDTDPEDEVAGFMLQSLGKSETPEAAPAEHVRRIFDRCAGTFERVLVGDLEYRTPELLFDLVRPHLAEEMNVLDLGCGTGLGAQLYRPFAKMLTGVDISPKMLEKAEEKHLYDRLMVFDVLKQWDFPEPFDLIYSSDVFVYFGNLYPILRSATASLSPEGILAFSVEKLEDGNGQFQLFPTGRYAHSLNYIRKCLEGNGLLLLHGVDATIRKQSGTPVNGLLVLATPAALQHRIQDSVRS